MRHVFRAGFCGAITGQVIDAEPGLDVAGADHRDHSHPRFFGNLISGGSELDDSKCEFFLAMNPSDAFAGQTVDLCEFASDEQSAVRLRHD